MDKWPIPFSEIAEKVYYPLFASHFTVSELREVIRFYETPAGRKYITAMPQIMQNATSDLNEITHDRITVIFCETAEELNEKVKAMVLDYLFFSKFKLRMGPVK